MRLECVRIKHVISYSFQHLLQTYNTESVSINSSVSICVKELHAFHVVV